MRGKRAIVSTFVDVPGITPAHAGKTYFLVILFDYLKDHPRACGENIKRKIASCYDTGSPPRMRGKLFVMMIVIMSHGITPAHAGKTSLSALVGGLDCLLVTFVYVF